jgi:hypothetical protein
MPTCETGLYNLRGLSIFALEPRLPDAIYLFYSFMLYLTEDDSSG